MTRHILTVAVGWANWLDSFLALIPSCCCYCCRKWRRGDQRPTRRDTLPCGPSYNYSTGCWQLQGKWSIWAIAKRWHLECKLNNFLKGKEYKPSFMISNLLGTTVHWLEVNNLSALKANLMTITGHKKTRNQCLLCNTLYTYIARPVGVTKAK